MFNTTNLSQNLYNDLLQESTKETGKLLTTIPKSINAALSPLRKWIMIKEYNLSETEKLLEDKLKNIDPNKIVSPESYVAVPVINSISYTMDNSTLRNLYANLLAKSMNVDTKDTVHPSFVEIIKQLSPNDAMLLNFLKDHKEHPIVQLRYYDTNLFDSYVTVKNNIFEYNLNFSNDNFKSSLVSLDNLIRLGLIDITYNEKIYSLDKNPYDLLENSKIIDDLKKSTNFPNHDFSIPKLMYGILSLTNFCTNFIDVCIK